jgi:predicted permease
MEKTLFMVLPFFLIALAGYLAARFRYLSESLFDALTQFVFAVALPIYLFRTLARTGLLDRSAGNLVEFLAIYFLAAAGALLIGMLVARFAFNAGSGEQTRMGVAGSQSNLVLLGIPAVVLILDSQVLTPMLLLVGLHGLVMALIVLIVQRVQSGRSGDPVKMAVDYAKSPLFIALVAGILFAKLDIPIPAKIDTALQTIAVTAVPCALFAFGGTLVRYSFGDRLQPEFAIAAVKLAAFPLLVWLLAIKLKLLAIPPSWAWVAVMLAAMPAGFELHGKGKRAGGEVSGATVLVSTLAGVFSVTMLVHIIRTA